MSNELINIDESNFKPVFFKWVWHKINLSRVSDHYKQPKPKMSLTKVLDNFKIYLYDEGGNRFDLGSKILKNADLLANILPYENNEQYESSKESLKALIYYSTKLLLKEY